MATPAQKKLIQKRLAAIREANYGRFKWPKWTGFSGKTGWDWLQVLLQLLGVIAIPLAIAIGTAYFSFQQNQTSMQLADDQQQEVTLHTYLDDMTTLLLDKKLGSQAAADKAASAEAAVVARAKTLIAFSRLNATRKATVMQFLYEAHLIGYCNPTYTCLQLVGPIIDLEGADLSHIDLFNAQLSGADLHGANLIRANLIGANLIRANVSGALLFLADLFGADLSGADLLQSDLRNANLSGVDLSGASLFFADLFGADLSGAHLKGAHLHYADLRNTNLSGADLSGADLSDANLYRATITNKQLLLAKSLKGATMPDGSIHP